MQKLKLLGNLTQITDKEDLNAFTNFFNKLEKRDKNLSKKVLKLILPSELRSTIGFNQDDRLMGDFIWYLDIKGWEFTRD